MNFKANNYYELNLKLIYITGLLFCISCGNSNHQKRIENSEFIYDEENIMDHVDSNFGGGYSDSMIAILTNPKEDFEVDSFSSLHDFDSSKFQFDSCNEFTIEMLAELDKFGMNDGVDKTIKYPEVSSAQRELLGISDYMCDKTFSEDFSMYVFHSDELESHFSNSIKLIVISKETNHYNDLVLSQLYLSENYEYKIESRFLSKNEFEIEKFESFKMSNESISDDSISLTIFKYMITDNGDIKLSK